MTLVAWFHFVLSSHVLIQFTLVLADKVANATTLFLMVHLDVCHEVKLMIRGECALITHVFLGCFSVGLFYVRDKKLQIFSLKAAVLASQISAVLYLLVPFQQ